MVIFNSSAVPVFPLTDDYDFVSDQLRRAQRSLTIVDGKDPFFAGTLNGAGSSLIGDGLATCVRSFDHPELQRARSVILASDNEAAGRSLFTLPEGGQLAKTGGIQVYGMNPSDNPSSSAAVEMRQVVESTGGIYFALNDVNAVRRTLEAVTSREATRIPSAPRTVIHDIPGVPIALAALAVLGFLALRRIRWRPMNALSGLSFLPVAPLPLLVVVAALGLALIWWPAGPRERSEPSVARGRRTAMVVLLLVAALRPAIPGNDVRVDASAVDVYLVVDTTSSVMARDYGDARPRLEGVRADIKALTTQLAGARFALVTFDIDTTVRLPLTSDGAAVSAAADTLRPETSVWSRGSSVTLRPRPAADRPGARARHAPGAGPARLLPRRRRADGGAGPSPVRDRRPAHQRGCGPRLRHRGGRPDGDHRGVRDRGHRRPVDR